MFGQYIGSVDSLLRRRHVPVAVEGKWERRNNATQNQALQTKYLPTELLQTETGSKCGL